MRPDKTTKPRRSESMDPDKDRDNRDDVQQLDGEKIINWLQDDRNPQLDREMARYLFGDVQSEEGPDEPRASGGSQC